MWLWVHVFVRVVMSVECTSVIIKQQRQKKVRTWQITGSSDSLHVAHTACSGRILSAMVLLRMVKSHTQHSNSVYFLKCLIKKKKETGFS